MTRRDSIIDDLHKLRERIGRAHGFDVDRIAATIRQHEREAVGESRAVIKAPARRTHQSRRRRRSAAQQRGGIRAN